MVEKSTKETANMAGKKGQAAGGDAPSDKRLKDKDKANVKDAKVGDTSRGQSKDRKTDKDKEAPKDNKSVKDRETSKERKDRDPSKERKSRKDRSGSKEKRKRKRNKSKGSESSKGSSKSKGRKGKKGKKDRDESKGRKSPRDRSKERGKKGAKLELEEIPKTDSVLAQEAALERAAQRQLRFKKQWPEVTQVPIKTKPWAPPPPPQKPPPVTVNKPQLKIVPWVPPHTQKKEPRPKLARIPPEEMTQPLTAGSTLKKAYTHNSRVTVCPPALRWTDDFGWRRRPMIEKPDDDYDSTGTQTACIAAICRAMLDEKEASQLVKQDVDDIIRNGDQFYRQCLLALKCYKGNPALNLSLLIPAFFLHDIKYTFKLDEVEAGVLTKPEDSTDSVMDLVEIMEKRIGTTFSFILTVGEKHFYVWGHPPDAEANSSAQTIIYIFDPHMLNEVGQPEHAPLTPGCCAQFGAAAFLRYAGISSFLTDFLSNYGDLEDMEKGKPPPAITITNIEIMQKEPLIRQPMYDIDMKAHKAHCRNEWEAMYRNLLYELKQKKEEKPVPPVAPEKGTQLTLEEIMAMRGEDFFLYSPLMDEHMFGRDDRADLMQTKSEEVIHSIVDKAAKTYPTQFRQLDIGRWILRATRHMASKRYQSFKIYTAIACCVASLAMLRRLRARAWNEDTLDETLDVGYNLYRESLADRGGPIRLLVLGELKKEFMIRDKEYFFRERGIAVWGKLVTNDKNVFDLCRGIEQFFKESDAGVLQVGIREGGKACLMCFDKILRLCEYFMDQIAMGMRRKPFAISDVLVFERLKRLPEPINKLKPVDHNRWVMRGNFNETDEKFPEEHRGKQGTPMSIVAVAMAHLVPPSNWTTEDIDETLERGDILYQNTLEHLDKLGINISAPKTGEEAEIEDTEITGPTGTLAAVDVLNRFRVKGSDCIETEVLDSAYTGTLRGSPDEGILSLKDSIKELFKDGNNHAILTARGNSMAIWKDQDCYYFFDPHGCDETGFPSQEARARAALVRVQGSTKDLADTIESNLSPGSDDSFNLSPVNIIATKLNTVINAPETILENKGFQWINQGTAAIMNGPRGENSALGKACEKAGVPADDKAGRLLALPCAAAFVAASKSVPPPHMHQDHIFNILDAGADYYLHHMKKTGRKDINVDDLSEKFEMGANTFSIELGEPITLPLRIPSESGGEGGDEDEDEDEEKEMNEGAEEEKEVGEKPMKHIKEALEVVWNDTTKPTTVHLLVGDYHQLGVWMNAGGKVVVFDAAPHINNGMLTTARIKKGDELRLQRLRDEMPGEAGAEGYDDDFGDDDDALGEGEEKPGEDQPVPPDSVALLMVYASPGEFLDKLAMQGPLTPVQTKAPYKLYPVTITNELTSVLKDRRNAPSRVGNDVEEKKEEEETAVEDSLVPELPEETIGKYFTRTGRSVASARGKIAQNEHYFLDHPNRDHQDAANAIMGIVVDSIEPYKYWKPSLIDAILKYGDRLYTMSLPNAKNPPHLTADEVVTEFHVTNFSVRLEVDPITVHGDYKAGETGDILNIKRGITEFFENNHAGVLCCKNYCIGIWKSDEGEAYCMWDAHAIGPRGRTSPGGAGGLVLFSTIDELAETYEANIEDLKRPGNNNFTIQAVKVFWEYNKIPDIVPIGGTVPDDAYEWKVLTGFVEIGRGRTILRGSPPMDLVKFAHDTLLQSACGAIVAACMSKIRQAALWTRLTVDEVMSIADQLFVASVGNLGYEFRPGEDVLLPLQVLKRFIIGVNYIRYDLHEIHTGKLVNNQPSVPGLGAVLTSFFESYTHGVLWSSPLGVAVWRTEGLPNFYMMEPHACGPTGLRKEEDDVAACVLSFSSPKLMAFAYLQNYSTEERFKREFTLYALIIEVKPMKGFHGGEQPVKQPKDGSFLVSATSKVRELRKS
ncbi:unnamed protein product [Plutella xylostella]|uniref:(diamondback moth) hypothetical protein n=1 Tax=Plutella xylostella TaxID=51655 RepID=A0A8S4FXA7_PLUXY|nr:unnamed protein product [Plutella xylostella]